MGRKLFYACGSGCVLSDSRFNSEMLNSVPENTEGSEHSSESFGLLFRSLSGITTGCWKKVPI